MVKVVEVIDKDKTPEVFAGFDRLEKREYEDEHKSKHLYGVEIDKQTGKEKSFHLNLGRLTLEQNQMTIHEVPTNQQVQELSQKVEDLESLLQNMSDRMDAMKQQFEEKAEKDAAEIERLKGENTKKEAEKAERDAEIVRLNQELEDYRNGVIPPPAPTPTPPPAPVPTPPPGPPQPNSLELGKPATVKLKNGAVIKDKYRVGDIGEKYIIFVDGLGNTVAIEKEEAENWQTLAPKEAEENPSDSKGSRYFNKSRGYVGSIIPFRNRTIIEEEERRDGYAESDIRAGTIALGAIAVAAVAIAGTVLVDHFEDKGEQGTTTTVVQTRIVHDQAEINADKELKASIDKETEADQALQASIDEQTKAIKANTEERRLDRRALRYNSRVVDKNSRIELQEINGGGRHGQNNYEAGSNSFGATMEDGTYRLHVTPGEGYTHIIQDVFPGRSGSDYYQAHLAAVRQFGPDYIRGVGHYRMASGDVGFLHTGNVRLESGVKAFLSQQLDNQ